MDLTTTATRALAAGLATTAAIALVAAPASAQDYLVQPGDTVSGIAASHGTTVSAIVAANHLDARATIYAGQHLDVPSTRPAAPTTHTVVKGETLWSLAATYGTTVQALADANALADASLIRIGQTLTLPQGATAPAPQAAAPTPPPAASAPSASHVVTKGDTLWDLSARYGVSVAAIVRANGIANAALIREGAVLQIPGAAGTPATAASTPVTTAASSTYVVRSGDTLSAIAARYGTTVSAIATANRLTNPSLLTVGQVLAIPGGAPTGLVGDTFLGRTYPASVVAAANVNKATLNGMTVPSRTQMQQLVVSTAASMGVDTALAQAIAYQESGFNQRAVSPANAIGCMQVIPSSGEWASDLVGRDLNLLDANDNVTAGVAILRQLTARNSLDVAIASYYQGERSVRERGMNPDTVRYVASVRALMDRFE